MQDGRYIYMSANKNTILVYACQPHTLYERKYKKYIHKVGIIPCKNCMYDRDDDADIYLYHIRVCIYVHMIFLCNSANICMYVYIFLFYIMQTSKRTTNSIHIIRIPAHIMRLGKFRKHVSRLGRVCICEYIEQSFCLLEYIMDIYIHLCIYT